MTTLGRLQLACLTLLFVSSAQAAVFEDDEARRAILDLRQRVENLRQVQQSSEAALQRSLDAVTKSQQTLREQAVRDMQAEASRLQQGMLQLQTQIDNLKQTISELRGEKDQLQREIMLLQKSQKDALSSLEERITKHDQRFSKLEPLTVQMDGLEFQVDPTEKKDFELALTTFKKGEFAGAITSFSTFLRKYPETGFRQSALFWLASAKYVKREYLDATNQLKAFITMNEAHTKFPEALLTLANSQIELKLPLEAKKSFEDLISQYPSSEAAEAAKERLQKLKLP
jgi:tol-pal system protein YbgF